MKEVLGAIDYKITVHIAGDRRSIKEVAAIWEKADKPSTAMRLYIGRRYRDALSLLAKEFGYAS